MNLRYELRRIERANKANPNREALLLDICKRYVPEETKNMLTFLKIIRWIDETWRVFAKETRLHQNAFREWVKNDLSEYYPLLW